MTYEPPKQIWVDDERPIGGDCHVYTDGTDAVLLYGTEYRRANAPLTFDEAMQLCPELGKFVEAANSLCFYAQTSGGTAGRDAELVAAINRYTAAFVALKGTKP